MPAPPFIYDPPSAFSFAIPIDREFNPRAATQASWAPRVPKTKKQEEPLIDFNKHPDSYGVPCQANLNVKPLHPRTLVRVQRAGRAQLFLRSCALLGALGLLFCAISINKTNSTIGWVIRVAPAVTLIHAIYAIYHLSRLAAQSLTLTRTRTPASVASYMIFAAVVDASLIPFLVFSAYVSYVDYSYNQLGWNTLFNHETITNKIIMAFFLLNTTLAVILIVCIVLDGYLAVVFRKISRLPPDLRADFGGVPTPENESTCPERNYPRSFASV